MLWILFAILLVFWLLGMVTGFLGGFIHILLVAAVVVLIFSILNRRHTIA
jgi:hypothetical protein